MYNYPQQLLKLLNIIKQNDGIGYIVGGAVRDIIMGNVITDWDVTTSLTPDIITNIFEDYKVIPTGLKYGTVTVIIDDLTIEVTTHRGDMTYTDKRHPDGVVFSDNLMDDLSRRDFTINAMCIEPFKNEIIDPFCGVDDIKSKIIRTVGVPKKRFSEDALRILRCFKFAARYGFVIESETAKAIEFCSHILKYISAERIKIELDGILMGNYAGVVINDMHNSNIWNNTLPEIDALFDMNTDDNINAGKHISRLFESTCLPNDLSVRWAALLHHVGNNSVNSSIMAKDILKRLHCDSAAIKKVGFLIKNIDTLTRCMDEPDYIIKKVISDSSIELFYMLIDLLYMHECDNPITWIDDIKVITDDIIERNDPITKIDMAINGLDLIKMGITGIETGLVINIAHDWILKNPKCNQKDVLLRKINTDYLKR